MAIHGMIDLETLDVTPTATILSLGCVKFSPYDNSEPHSELYFKIDIDEQSDMGRTTSDSTIEWWRKQDEKVVNEAFSEDGRTSVEDVLDAIRKWTVGIDVIWGHGYGFDLTILENLFKQAKQPIPWNFWQVRDSRTLFACLDRDPRKSMQTDLHNALADSYYQAKSVQVAYSDLGIEK